MAAGAGAGSIIFVSLILEEGRGGNTIAASVAGNTHHIYTAKVAPDLGPPPFPK